MFLYSPLCVSPFVPAVSHQVGCVWGTASLWVFLLSLMIRSCDGKQELPCLLGGKALKQKTDCTIFFYYSTWLVKYSKFVVRKSDGENSVLFYPSTLYLGDLF